jgi:PAS domain S-box-containing protein
LKWCEAGLKKVAMLVTVETQKGDGPMATPKAPRNSSKRPTNQPVVAEAKQRAPKRVGGRQLAPPKLLDFYREFFEHAPVGLCLCLMNGDFIKVNQAFADLLGRPMQDLIGCSYQSFTPEKYKHEDEQQIRKLQEIGKVELFEKEYIQPNGQVIPIRIVINLVTIDQIQYIWVMAENSSNHRYRVLFQQAPMGLALCELGGAFVHVNEAFAKITGWTVDELLGRTADGKPMTYWDLTPPELHDQERKVLESLKIDGRYGPFTKDYIHQDGTRVSVTLTGLLLKQGDKEYIWSTIDKGKAVVPPLPAPSEAARPIRPLPRKALSCFISYSHHDEAFASMLYTKLREENIQAWFAPAELFPGQRLNPAINDGIHKCDRLLLVLSKHSMASKWVQRELRRARQIEEDEGVKKLIPIRLVDYDAIEQWEMPAWTLFSTRLWFVRDLAEDVRAFFIPDFSKWEDPASFKRGFDRLLQVLSPDE